VKRKSLLQLELKLQIETQKAIQEEKRGNILELVKYTNMPSKEAGKSEIQIDALRFDYFPSTQNKILKSRESRFVRPETS